MAAAAPAGSTSASNGEKPAGPLPLTDTLMGKLKPAKIFKGAVSQPVPQSPGHGARGSQPKQITGMSCDDFGEHLITASDDESFRLYSCRKGIFTKTFYSKKYGVDLPRFTHKDSAIIHASTKEDDTIRYHSLHDNKYLQYFKGHSQRVVSLEMSPVDDGFMSGSIDRTVRLWDLRSPICRGLLHLPSSPLVAYDNSGVVFAVAVNTFCRILLYDMANFDKEPFLTMTLEDPLLKLISFPPRQIFMTSLHFSSNGKYLLVGTSGSAHYILDAFEGHLLAKLEGHIGLERYSITSILSLNPVKGISGEEVKWAPDSKFVVSGSLDGKICVWDVGNLPKIEGVPVDLGRKPEVLKPCAVLEGHPGPSRCVRFNSRYLMMATAGTELVFWLPDLVGDGSDEVKDHFRKKLAG